MELISDYVTLKPAGRNFKGLCPFHAEKTPSFVVNPERGSWRCFGCGEGGDLFSFVQKIESISFVEAAERLARRAGVEFRRRGETRESASERERLLRANALAERFFRRELEQAPAVRQYLQGRGLAPETIEAFHLGFAPSGWTRLLEYLSREKVDLGDAQKVGLVFRNEHGWRDRFVERVIFPIFDLQGRPIAFGGRALGEAQPKYLNSPETPIFIKGKTLYGLDRARTAIATLGFAVAVEGYMDLIACHQAGFTQTVATLGTALTPEHLKLLKRYAARLVLAYDGDAAGMRATLRSAPQFEEAGMEVRVLRLPRGSDPDSFLAERGRQAFQALIDAAVPLLDFQLCLLEEKFDLRQPEQRRAMVQEATDLIARMPSRITREHYTGRLNEIIRRLAERWYPTQIERAREAERAIREELARRGRATARGRTGGAPAATGATAKNAVPAPRARTAALEEYLLRAALTHDGYRSELLQKLRAEQFADAQLRPLVEILFARDPLKGEVTARVHGDPELAKIASALLVDEGRPPITPEGVAEAIGRMQRLWKQTRRLALEREIGERGLSRTDPRYQEYLQLVHELGQDAKGDE